MSQVVVVPYPGRGHINPLLNLCHLLSSKILNKHECQPTIFTFVVTEEWLGFIKPDPKHTNIRFVTIPNVLPSELNRGSNIFAFLTAVTTKMQGPVEKVLDQVDLPVELIIADSYMSWPFDVANNRNIPIAAFWPMSASMFSLLYHVDLLQSHEHLYVDVSEKGKECIDYIPGLSSLTVADIPPILHDGIGQKFKGLLPVYKEITKKADYLLLSTMYELESKAIDALRAIIHIPIYTCGPNIPYCQIKPNDLSSSDQPMYLKWLDAKPPRTVLYVSLGSYLSATRAEMDEMAAGLSQSGVSFLWVARGDTARLEKMCGEQGMVVEWCDQLQVLSHTAIGGFWTHCGWNSVKESLFSGMPMLTFPITLDQPLNCKVIVEDWKIGLNMKKEVGVFKKDEIAGLVRRFMDMKNVEGIEMMERAKELQKICQESVAEGGSTIQNLDAFVKEGVKNQNK